MAKPLVIVESPAKAKTIAGYLGDDYTVMASVGHIRDLPATSKDEVPDDKKVRRTAASPASTPTTTSTSSTSCTPTKKKVVAELKQALKGADELILATDEDREGEAIGWHVLEVLQPKVPVKRMVFHEITPHAIREALDNPRELDMKLVEAQEGRRILDRLVGWETSPVLWRVFGRGQAASAGRVQSVAVRMVVERERARMRVPLRPVAATSKPTFVARRSGRSAPRSSSSTASALAEGRDFDPATGSDRAPTRAATSCCSTRRARPRSPTGCATPRSAVASVESDPFTERPRAPFTTSTLQQESGRKLRFGAARTMVDRAAALRARLHHLHANRQHQPVGAGDHRGAHRDPRAVRRGVPARRAARLPQQGEERAGGARGDPARPAIASARPTQCAPSSTPTSNGSTS